MEIYVVIEYTEHAQRIIGCYKNEQEAREKARESLAWRYVEKQTLL